MFLVIVGAIAFASMENSIRGRLRSNSREHVDIHSVVAIADDGTRTYIYNDFH